MLAAGDYRSILAVLRACSGAEDTEEFRRTALEAVMQELGYEHLTFFLGQHPTLELQLREPVFLGIAEPLIDKYLSSFAADDLFATDRARTALRVHGSACLPRLLDAEISLPQTAYVEDFLVPSGITDKTMIWLDTELPVHGFLGVIGVQGTVYDARDKAILTELRPHLSAQLRRHLRFDSAGFDTGPLTVREHQVARLVADGWTNRSIARHLCIGESTVKKHNSRILAKLGVQSRTELAAVWRTSKNNRLGTAADTPTAV